MGEATKLAWGWPSNSRKAHVFFDGRSLCGKWGFFGTTDPVKVPEPGTTYQRGPDDCAACAKKLTAHLRPPSKAAPCIQASAASTELAEMARGIAVVEAETSQPGGTDR